jgi:CheY-like chemotaxis protein
MRRNDPARFDDEALGVADQRQGRIELLLTDGVMPVMSGTELAERLRDLHPRRQKSSTCPVEREPLTAKDLPEDAFLASRETGAAPLQADVGRPVRAVVT